MTSSTAPATSQRPPRRTRRLTMTPVQLGQETIDVHGYRPKLAGAPPGPLMLVFPGYERNAEDYVRRARRVAKRHGMTVFAPSFDQDRFPRARYQRAGLMQPDADAASSMGQVLAELAAWARASVGRPDAPLVLFGHSAGAQMLSRVAAFHPLAGVQRIVIANPSSYVAPSMIDPMPFGFAGDLDVLQREAALRAYLAQPISIYLGTDDTGTARLDDSRVALRQGRHRLERGRNMFEVGQTLARQRNWAFAWRLVLADGVGHSSRGMLRAEAIDAALVA